MIEELVIRVFESRNASHIAHWKAASGFHHVVLGEFYDGVIDHIDSLVEAYQGAFGLIKVEEVQKLNIPVDIVPRLEEDLIFISANRKEITKGLQALDNILQTLEDLYLSTVYKLKHLQ